MNEALNWAHALAKANPLVRRVWISDRLFNELSSDVMTQFRWMPDPAYDPWAIAVRHCYFCRLSAKPLRDAGGRPQ